MFPQSQGSEAGKPVTGRKDQHQDRRLRHGVVAAQRQYAGDELRFTALRVSRSHPGKLPIYQTICVRWSLSTFPTLLCTLTWSSVEI